MSVIELFEKNKGWFLAVKNTAALAHYSKKCKYLQNIFKISLRKTSFHKRPFRKIRLRTDFKRIFISFAISKNNKQNKRHYSRQ